MSSGLSSFHRILKDKTRSQIILLLNDKGNLSYTDLMNQIGIKSTGKLNYHLKMLDDLITKNSDGAYMLTEKGILAVKLLRELSKNNQTTSTHFSLKNFMTSIVSSGLFLVVVLFLYFYGITGFEMVVFGLTILFGSIVSVIIAAKLPTHGPKHTPEKRRTGTKIGFIILGAAIGMVGGILGGSLLLLASIRSLRLAGVSPFFTSAPLWAAIGSIVGITIGGLASYIIFRRSKYSKIENYYEVA